ncbi:MAG: hypothetical protein U1F43_09895 [Myxococcota bacterium]
MLALCLLLVSGPGWAALVCGCGEAPKAVCCCCEKKDAREPAGPAMKARTCERVEVGKADLAPSSGAVESLAPAPPAVPVTVVLAPVVVTLSVAHAPVRAPATGGDPPYIRTRSLRC